MSSGSLAFAVDEGQEPPERGARSPSLDSENYEIDSLVYGARAVDQEQIERDVAARAEKALREQANENDTKRLDKVLTAKEKQLQMLQLVQSRYEHAADRRERAQILQQINEFTDKVREYEEDIQDIRKRLQERSAEVAVLGRVAEVHAPNQRLPNETEHEFLIRTGKITPFANVPGLERKTSNIEATSDSSTIVPIESTQTVSQKHLRRPGFQRQQESDHDTGIEAKDEESELISSIGSASEDTVVRDKKRKVTLDDDSDYAPPSKRTLKRGSRKARKTPVTASDSDEESDDYYVGHEVAIKRKKSVSEALQDNAVRLDDGDEKSYQQRLKNWCSERKALRVANATRTSTGTLSEEISAEEWYMPHPSLPDMTFSGGFKLPGDIHPSLFDYQKIGVQWLWELHCQGVGAILADEMGLGKTIQIISLLAGLHYSDLLDKPCLIVAPGAVLKQWANEFHLWWPAMRVAILHSSGSGMLVDTGREDEDSDVGSFGSHKRQSMAKKIVDRVFKHGHVLITTYEGLTTFGGLLSKVEFAYAILDEGHRIRNPDAAVTLTCKQLKTVNRIIVSGTPIQNNLIELWSLFDFVFPGRLGILPVFKEQFEIPIRLGGYKNASNTQVQTALKCTLVLREFIGPYLLRRLKVDVASDLPKKHEQVLFCKLTKAQRDAYQAYLDSTEVQKIMDKRLDLLSGITVLGKICNHPDLVDRELLEHKPGYEYGKASYSGKMQVLRQLMAEWKKGGHRTLLFTQGKQILNILEKNMKQDGFKYRRMDGDTPIHNRQNLVHEFNRDDSIDVFLLTTRVGGLGLNLTGADRVVIFEPNWNPSTDLQARERAWRIGQKKPVTIYRLILAGTIEEKIYHRQIFKQHLANKVFTDPNQSRFFESSDLHSLFKLGGSTVGGTETGAMFRGMEKVYLQRNSPNSSAAVANDEQLVFRNINGVAGLHEHVNKEDGAVNGTGSNKESGEMQFIEGIFGNGGVLSALEHDSVVGAAAGQEVSRTEQYATEVAEAAAKALRESVAQTQKAPIGTVTWTGRNGSAGRERPGASDLLSTLKNKNPTNRIVEKRPARNVSADSKELIFKMHRYFKDKGGELTTPEVKDLAKRLQVTEDTSVQFRSILKQIATLNKEKHLWTLKADYIAR